MDRPSHGRTQERFAGVAKPGNLRGTWDSVALRLGGDATRRNLQRIWVRTFTSMLPPRMLSLCCSEWAEPGRFSQQEPVVMLWGDLCPAS
jgi:hypothetical protein